MAITSVANSDGYFRDIRDIDDSFPFDVLVCDAGFYAMHLVKEKLGKRVWAVGVAPSLETSKDVPPNFAGLSRPGTRSAGWRTVACERSRSAWSRTT